MYGNFNTMHSSSRYVAPEYACTGMLNEKSDIYSFGILIMEVITGRSPVDYSRPQGEVSVDKTEKLSDTFRILFIRNDFHLQL